MLLHNIYRARMLPDEYINEPNVTSKDSRIVLPKKKTCKSVECLSAKDLTQYRAKGSHVSTFMSFYVTGDMTRRVSAPSETEPLDNKTRHIVPVLFF